MDIRFIKKSTEKISTENLMKIMSDVIMLSNFEVIENFDKYKTYSMNDKVYLKYKNRHRVFICQENSVQGEFDISKWRPYLKKEEEKINLNQLDTFEETIVVDREGLFDYKIKLDDFKYKNTSVAAFNSINPRLRYGIDFTFTSDGVVKFLKPFNIGEKIILEIRRLNGKLFNNMFKEVYVEETYIPLKTTKSVPIRYHGYSSTSKLEIFTKSGKLLEEGLDYRLDHNIIILNEPIEYGDRLSITMWNKVMITITSDNYIIDELGNFYKLNISDTAQLILEDVDDDNILSKGYIDLISDNGTPYRCSATSKGQLILREVEPDIILSLDNKKYKICVNTNGELYLEEVDIDFYKNIYLISADDILYELCVKDGKLDIEQITSSPIIDALEYKHIVSDDNRIYEITIDNGRLLLKEIPNPHREENPIEYMNLISPSGINFMFFATNDGHIAVRCVYIVDNESNVIVGDNGILYYIGMTNEGDLFTQKLYGAPFAAEHKLITDGNGVEYEIHIDNDECIYFEATGKVAGSVVTVTLDSDAKDSYICNISEGYLNSYPYSKSSILKDIKTGFEYKLYVDNNELKIARVQTELIEKDYIPLITSNKFYKLVINNSKIELQDTGIILPEKEDVNFKLNDLNGTNEYVINVDNHGNIIIE